MTETSGAGGRPFAGQGAVLLCAVCWSTSGLFIKLLDWHPLVIAGGRSLLAALFLYALRVVSRAKTGAAGRRRSLPMLILGSVNYALTMILFVIANKLTASANAILLQYTAPVWAALLGWFFLNERPRAEHWGALAMVGVGMVLFFKNSLGNGALGGDIVALVSGVSFGANAVILRKAKDQNPADIMLGANITAALASIPFWVMFPPSPGLRNFACVCALGFVQIGAASALFAWGIQRVTVIQAMLITMLEPVLNPVWVLLVTGERPSAAVIVGGGIILCAVILSSIISAQRGIRKSAWRLRN